MSKLDRQERELLESVDRGEWQSMAGSKKARKRYQEYAKATFKKDRRVNIRISTKDLEAIQRRAIEEGIPYQTLIASLLHKYVSGRLVEKKA
jgi:predicted DNA binding CopG/RHH family protein